MARLSEKAVRDRIKAGLCCQNCASWTAQPGDTVGECGQGYFDPVIPDDPYCSLTCSDRTCKLFKPRTKRAKRGLLESIFGKAGKFNLKKVLIPGN